MKHGDFADITSHMFHLRVREGIVQGDLKKGIDSGMSDDPTKRLQYVPLHLSEHIVLVQRAAHGLQLLDGWDAVLAVSVFGGDQKSGAADQLVVALVDHSLRTVSIE